MILLFDFRTMSIQMTIQQKGKFFVTKITPSYEACMKAYQYILPTFIELAKEDANKEKRKLDEKSA